jgi:hypothetical protein
MRKVELNQPPMSGKVEDQIKWITEALREIERASRLGENSAERVFLKLGTAGVASSGTVKPDPLAGFWWQWINGGAHTFAPSANYGEYVADITNNGSAGAITTASWTKVTGAFTTTNGHKFRCRCSIGPAGSLLAIQAMQ